MYCLRQTQGGAAYHVGHSGSACCQLLVQFKVMQKRLLVIIIIMMMMMMMMMSAFVKRKINSPQMRYIVALV